GPAAVPALVAGLNHGDPVIASSAAELLGELKQPEGIAPLITTLKFAARPVQMGARRGLIRLGTAAVPALEEARAESGGAEGVWLRRQIEEILAEIRAGA